MTDKTFIVDCPTCKAKVGAVETGRAQAHGMYEDVGEPYGQCLYVGKCPKCQNLIAAESWQTGFEGRDSEYDIWSEPVRVFPNPPKTFSSSRVPRIVVDSLNEADRALQVNAHIAACVMLGRAIEAMCRDILVENPTKGTGKRKAIMLGQGVKLLHERKMIDDRLYDWSRQLNAFRNYAAHPDETTISRRDAEDLQTFAYAIIEYIYDLTDRYNEFMQRASKQKK